ncbi:MAG: TonB-dependent receptor, partial [Cyclobacteriaceae bacterium]
KVFEALSILKKQVGIEFKVSNEKVLLSYNRKSYTISGTIKDSQTGESLIGAAVIVGNTSTGTISNSYGFFSLTLPEGIYQLSFRYLGYESLIKEVKLESNTLANTSLKLIPQKLDQVTVTSRSPEHNITNMVPGVIPISFGDAWPIPYFLGETDIFQNSLLLPGIRSIGEDATGLNIRGGDIDQNLILLDEAPIYNPNHFYGLISVFNPEVINNVDILKGYIPPQYGGRASSVINIYQRDGNNKEFKTSGGIGIVSGRLAIEGPIVPEKSSFLLSYRRSLLNFSVEDFLNASLDESRYRFQDINLKLNWTLNPKNKLYLSGYFGQDRNRAGFDAIRKWGNRSLSFRWNHIFNPRLFSNFSAIASNYTYQISDPQEVGSFIGKSSIRDISIKSDFGFIVNPRNTIDFGVQTTYHKLKPGERIPFDENAATDSTFLDNEDAIESAIYLSHKSDLTSKLSVQYGLRLSMLHNFGPGEFYKYEENMVQTDETIIDTVRYSSGEIFNRSYGWEPRISLNYMLNERQSIKASYTRNHQYIHLISNTVAPSPTDIWKLSDPNVKPTISDHFSLGFYQNLANNVWESSIEVYYKEVNNVIDFKAGADLLFNQNIETELLNGIGESYGVEFYLRKRVGKTRGWISYTWSKAEQKFSNIAPELTINNGNFFPTDYDKRHDLTVTGIHTITNRLSVSSTFNYNSGRPITLPVGKFVFDGKTIPHFENRNLERLPNYHRLDISVRLDGKSTKRSGKNRKVEDYWVFTVYNVYAQENTYSYFFEQSENDPNVTIARPYSIFRTAIPAVTYNFKF